MGTRRQRDDIERDYRDDYDDYDDDVPLHHKKAFGAGIKRQRVEFVRARDPDEDAVGTIAKANNGAAIGDLYASLVLMKPTADSNSESKEPSTTATPTHKDDTDEYPICPVCDLPITTTAAKHSASLAHQVSLEHSHPPSHLDRTRMGLRALESHGWDPDSRRGLGLEGEGMRFPVKLSAKEDTLGIGATIPEVKVEEKKPKPLPMMNKREIKQERVRERKRAERLQAELYGRVDVEAYLRGNGNDT